MSEELTIGLDIGGTKMAFVIADRAGSIHKSLTLPTELGADCGAAFDYIGGYINTLLEEYSSVCGIGIGVPGPVLAERGIALHAANLGWKNVPVGERVAARLSRDLPIYVENDVNCGVIGETLFGVAQDKSHLVYLNVGTGFGGAAMVNGKLMHGVSHSEMEIGHISLDPLTGRECSCGMRGCLEMTVAGKGIVAHAQQHLPDYHDSPLHALGASTQAIVAQATAGDALAAHVMEEAGKALGIACAWCVNLFNPQLIILAGGVIHAAYHLLEGPMYAELKARSLPINASALEVRLAKLTDAALGASALVWYHQSLESRL